VAAGAISDEDFRSLKAALISNVSSTGKEGKRKGTAEGVVAIDNNAEELGNTAKGGKDDQPSPPAFSAADSGHSEPPKNAEIKSAPSPSFQGEGVQMKRLHAH
jgi:hypothetical protein